VTSVPTGATTGNVVVTVGGVASNGVTFTVTPTAEPVITSATTASGTVGTASSYQITATNTPTSFGIASRAIGERHERIDFRDADGSRNINGDP
jgi:hypothetical protein